MRVARVRAVGAVVATAALTVLARLGARYLPDKDSVAERRVPCGSITWRTRTVSRTSFFDPAPQLVELKSTLEQDGKVVLEGVAQVACSMTRDFTFVAVVTHREGDRKAVSLFDARDGTRLRLFAPERSFDVALPSRQFKWIALASNAGEVRLFDLARDVPPIVVPRTRPIVASSLAWSENDELCFIDGKRPDGSEEPLHLACTKPGEATKEIAETTWFDHDAPDPWVGFSVSRAHLCGRGLRPQDAQCASISRDSR